MEALNLWIIRLTGAALISAAAIAIAPDGGAKRAVRLVCGLISVAALLSIGADLNPDSYARSLALYRAGAEDLVSDAEKEAETMKRVIIEERAAAYILDKAAELSVEDFSVSVTAEWSGDGYWYPVSAKVTSSATDSQRRTISHYMESELGIALERQEWKL